MPRTERRDLDAKAEAVRLFYQRHGYFEAAAEILPPNGGEPAILRVSEGAPCRVASVTVLAAEDGPPDEADGPPSPRISPSKKGRSFRRTTTRHRPPSSCSASGRTDGPSPR